MACLHFHLVRCPRSNILSLSFSYSLSILKCWVSLSTASLLIPSQTSPHIVSPWGTGTWNWTLQPDPDMLSDNGARAELQRMGRDPGIQHIHHHKVISSQSRCFSIWSEAKRGIAGRNALIKAWLNNTNIYLWGTFLFWVKILKVICI